MVRSILLRGFDQGMAEKLGEYLSGIGIKFIRETIPEKIERTPHGMKSVTWIDKETNQPKSESFQTILFAIGRTADTHSLNLEKLGVKLDKSNQKVIVGDDDQTSVSNIYAIGDCAKGRLELTPTAIMAGQLLAKRLFALSAVLMDYRNVPTTIFTPLEYSSCGYSEEAAKDQFTEENITVIKKTFKPVEWSFSESRPAKACQVKIIIRKDDDMLIGLHYLGPNAGEVLQGYAVAIKMGCTQRDLFTTVGIHPTCSEEIVGDDKIGC